MKRIFTLLLAGALLLSLSACGEKNDGAPQSTAQNAEAPQGSRVSDPAPDAAPKNEAPPQPFGTILKGAPGTLPDGLSPLPAVHYTVSDPNNTRGLSTKKTEHSHGPASGGQPHRTVVEFQKTFDRFGALTLDRTSAEKVLYLTFDCGYEYENLSSRILDTLKEKQVPAAFFCTRDHIEKQPELIARMIREGHIVGNHSDTHPSFAAISRTQMKDEIEATENFLRERFGYCAKFFRFPAGEYTESALELVQSLGYCSVFWSVAYNDWNVDAQQGKDAALNTVVQRLHDGAVILLHAVSRDNAEALGEIIDTARSMGYAFRALSDYRPPAV